MRANIICAVERPPLVAPALIAPEKAALTRLGQQALAQRLMTGRQARDGRWQQCGRAHSARHSCCERRRLGGPPAVQAQGCPCLSTGNAARGACRHRRGVRPLSL